MWTIQCKNKFYHFLRSVTFSLYLLQKANMMSSLETMSRIAESCFKKGNNALFLNLFPLILKKKKVIWGYLASWMLLNSLCCLFCNSCWCSCWFPWANKRIHSWQHRHLSELERPAPCLLIHALWRAFADVAFILVHLDEVWSSQQVTGSCMKTIHRYQLGVCEIAIYLQRRLLEKPSGKLGRHIHLSEIILCLAD